MKKVLLAMAMMAMVVAVNAQGWGKVHLEGDELKGIEEADVFMYSETGKHLCNRLGYSCCTDSNSAWFTYRRFHTYGTCRFVPQLS